MNSFLESNYTETFEELLVNQGYGTENQSQSLTEIINIMQKFPDFVFEDTTISMLELFIDKYDVREIGSETEQLFMHYWRERAQKLFIDYSPKIKMWLDHFDELFKFTVKLEFREGTRIDNTVSNTFYLNPINSNTENLKPQNVDSAVTGGNKSRNYSKDVLQSVWGKTRAQLLEQIFDIKNLYTDCLEEFESLFMGVL